MTLMLLGQYFLIMRSSMVDVLTEDFITVKRATGLPWHRVVRSHAVPNALLPLVTALGDPVRARRRGRDHDRDDLLLARARRAQLQRDQRQGLPGAPRDVPRLLGRRDPRQPDRRLPLLLPRPAGADASEREPGAAGVLAALEPQPASGGFATLLLGTWRGRFGLAVLGLFAFIAIFGAALAPDDPNASSLEVLAAAQLGRTPGHDRERRRRLLADPGRRPGLDRRRLRGGADLGGARLGRRPRRAATSAAGPTGSSTRSRTGSS